SISSDTYTCITPTYINSFLPLLSTSSPPCLLSSPLRLYLRGYSGTAGGQSSLTPHGTGFSTRDQDHDNCDHCKCALMLTGGWWFDACGFSNLNGIYYTVGHNIRKLNGIKWHHFRGPSYSLQSTSMMVRPYDF
ncbi:angiopoietin-1-like, partial [Gymnodraco acuticeps]|uniref:Angiopoietin-1-like n=1 Tax=Gymnodraco acuticeps TaxID=8218 RepID=A0A6P8U2X0_GYMAC